MNLNTRRLFDAIRAIDRGAADTVLDELAAGWRVYDWRDILLDLPIDSATFASQLETSWDVSISTLEGWSRRFAAPRNERVLGFAGVLLLTLVSLRYSELRRVPRNDLNGAHTGCQDSCHWLVENAAVQAALADLYAPRMTDSDGPAVLREWESVDFGTLRFHRHGTTSFIVTGQLASPTHGRLAKFALKLIIYPFLRIPTIARATRGYASEFNLATAELPHLVGVWASSGSWILMDFVPGQTLAERLAPEFSSSSKSGFDAKSPIRLDLIEKFGKELFLALADLERLGKQHGDLTPSNIMVVRTPDGREQLRLIDLGVNYLYLRNMPGHGSVDAPYVAPEIREVDEHADPAETSFAKSDLYSLGQLIVLLGCGAPASGGYVPEAFYAQAPSIARFVEDLIDADPRRRLLFVRQASTGLPYEQLWASLTEEVAATRAGGSERRWWSDVAALADPFLGTAWRLFRLWRERRKQRSFRMSRSGGLFAWSLLSALCATLTAVLISIWIRRAVGWDWDNDVIVALQRLTGARPDQLPIIDQLRSSGYRFPPGLHPVALGLLALTFTLIGVKYYQSLFAGVTPRSIGRRAGRLGVHATAAEAGMRFWTVAPVLMVLPPLLVQPLWWGLFAAGGMTIVTICNWLAASYGRAVIKEARRLGMSTVPERISGISTYLSWIPGNTFYAIFLWAVGILLYVELAQDTMVYVVAIGLVNVVQLYVVKCSIQGPDIRAGLGRACIAAERIRHLRLTEPAVDVVIPRRRGGADLLRSRDEPEAAPGRP